MMLKAHKNQLRAMACAADQDLRRRLRHKRRHLSRLAQRQHAQKIARRIIHSRLYKHATSIALYLAADGEVDLGVLLEQLRVHNKHCYLPVILSKKQAIMRFAPYKAGSALKRNCYGIAEPLYHKKHLKSAMQIDLILAPLVAFDKQGNRMGMGGGFYDRALQALLPSRNKQQRVISPRVVGIAHSLQCLAQIDKQPWDISLDAIVTEQYLKNFSYRAP